ARARGAATIGAATAALGQPRVACGSGLGGDDATLQFARAHGRSPGDARPMTFTPAQRQTLSWLALGAAVALALWTLAPVLTPFLIAAVLAYALQPAVEALAVRRVPRALAVLLVELALLVAALALVLLVVPILPRQLPLLRDQVPQLLDRLNASLAPWLAQLGLNVALDTASLKAMVLGVFDTNTGDWLSTALKSARIGGSLALTVIGNAVLVPVALFYLLADWA